MADLATLRGLTSSDYLKVDAGHIQTSEVAPAGWFTGYSVLRDWAQVTELALAAMGNDPYRDGGPAEGDEMYLLSRYYEVRTAELFWIEKVVYDFAIYFFHGIDVGVLNSNISELGNQSYVTLEKAHFKMQKALEGVTQGYFQGGRKDVNSPSNLKMQAVFNKWHEIRGGVQAPRVFIDEYYELMYLALDATQTLFEEIPKDQERWDCSAFAALVDEGSYNREAAMVFPAFYRLLRSSFLTMPHLSPGDVEAFEDEFYDDVSKNALWRFSYNLMTESFFANTGWRELGIDVARYDGWLDDDRDAGSFARRDLVMPDLGRFPQLRRAIEV
ncbi:MAG: hypothetical protein SP1CHLAM54_09430 [Chlamydiia bacterium]|nr:hypothetical protein [Chlamydiia bacterium]MCH9615849.1 hypothetical protein [Chlamydiia bacterium]MCH9628748.1 hypothetical protein [Chlamydiia bacterium]